MDQPDHDVESLDKTNNLEGRNHPTNNLLTVGYLELASILSKDLLKAYSLTARLNLFESKNMITKGLFSPKDGGSARDSCEDVK